MNALALPASTGTALAPHIIVEGTDLSAALTNQLLELRVLVGVRTVGRCTLRFSTPGFELATKSPFGIGREVKVAARGTERGAALGTLFAGVVTSVGLDHRAGDTPELVVVAQDKSWELTHAATTKVLTQQTYDDVLRELVKPLSLRTSGLPGGPHEYLLRSGTALSFIDEIVRRVGGAWVVHESDFHVWVGTSSTVRTAVTLTGGTDLDEFSVRVTDDVPTKVTVRGWDSKAQRVVEADATVPRTLPGSLETLAGKLNAATREHLVADLGPIDTNEAGVLARAVAGRGRVVARGKGPVQPDLRPGGTVTIEEMGPANGTYPVREVEHVYTRSGFRTRFLAGDRDLAPDTGGAGHGSPGFRHAGLVVGTVERLNLGDLGSSKRAAKPADQVMARVTLPGVDGAVSTHWARLATVGGGAGSGIEFLPEVGDEVVVGFEGGDLRQPVVLGGLHGAKATIPTGLDKEGVVMRRRIVSRRGHVIEIGDGTSEAEEFIRLHLKDEKVSLRLGKDRADLTMPSGKPLKIKVGDSFIEMDGNGAVKVEGTTISIKGTQKVTLEGPEIVLKGTQKVSASALQVELKAQATATVEGTAQTVIKGGMVQIN